MTLDSEGLAALLAALAEIPLRMAAVEREQARLAAEVGRIGAALPPVLVSVTEAARAVKVSLPTMRRWVKSGAVPTIRVAGTVRVDISRLSGVDGNTVARLARDARQA